MDSIRPLLRVSVVGLSLALMVTYVWYSGRRSPAHMPTPVGNAGVATPSTQPGLQLNAPLPAAVIFGSKSAPVFHGTPNITQDGQGVVIVPLSTTRPTMLHGSKSMILMPVQPSPLIPTTQPTPR